MSSKEIQDLILGVQHLKDQLNRIVSDIESEKEVRRERNTGIDKRLHDLEVDKIVRDTTIKNVGILWGVIGTITGAALTIIINHYFK